MYQALYRKWRPKTFDDVVGQTHISETLKNQVASGRLSHAYLFVGTRGTGKTTCAKILSKAVNCLNPQNGNPCNACSSCTGIDDGSILDVLELDAASNNGVDNVRALREEAVFSPVDVKKRVYIIDEVHMLSMAAFNALLKILEEPPAHLIFILATTEIHKVPATILSRCQRFTFKRILPAVVAERLQAVAASENLTLTDGAARLLARLSDGSMRDALSLLDQCATGDVIDENRVVSAIGLAENDEIVLILTAVADGNISLALEVLDKLYMAGKVMTSVLESLTSLVRDLLVMSLMPGGGNVLLSGGFDPAALETLKTRFTTPRLLSMMDILREALQDSFRSGGGRLGAEICLMRLCALTQEVAGGRAPAVSAPARAAAQPGTGGDRTTEKQPAPDPHPQKQDVPDAALQMSAPQEQPPSSESAEGPDTPISDDAWSEILKRVSKKIDDPGANAFLTDPTQASARIEGATVTIRTKGGFMANVISGAAVVSAIKEAASAVLNRPAVVRVVQDDGSTVGGNDKLDKLKSFSNVKFEE